MRVDYFHLAPKQSKREADRDEAFYTRRAALETAIYKGLRLAKARGFEQEGQIMTHILLETEDALDQMGGK